MRPSQLVALVYADEYRAAEVLATLQRLRTGAIVRTQDAVSVARDTAGAIRIQHSADLAANDEPMGRFWRSLVGVMFLEPDNSTTPTSPETSGLDTAFAERLCAALPPGSSSMLVIVPRSMLTRVLPELERFGGTLLDTPIERSAVEQIRSSASPNERALEGG